MAHDSSNAILVVEDEENDVFFLKRTIDKAGFTNPIHVVSNGSEAVDYLAGNREYVDRLKYPLPSLLFLDLHLPGKSGLEVLSWMRKQAELASIVVILLTSSKEETSIATACAMGANSYLVKPPSVDSMKVVIEALTQYERGL